MIIYDRLMCMALGFRREHRHKRGRENKNITKLQNWLDDNVSKEASYAKPIKHYWENKR